MNIYKKREADRLVVTLEGRLDSNTASKLEEELLPFLNGVRELKLDFSFLDYLSSAGLRVLLMAYKRVHSQGGSMKLTHVNDTIRSILKAVNFRELLTIEGENAPASKKALPECLRTRPS